MHSYENYDDMKDLEQINTCQQGQCHRFLGDYSSCKQRDKRVYSPSANGVLSNARVVPRIHGIIRRKNFDNDPKAHLISSSQTLFIIIALSSSSSWINAERTKKIMSTRNRQKYSSIHQFSFQTSSYARTINIKITLYRGFATIWYLRQVCNVFARITNGWFSTGIRVKSKACNLILRI